MYYVSEAILLMLGKSSCSNNNNNSNNNNLDIVKRVPSLKPKPEVDFRLCGHNLEKSIRRHNFAESGPIWMKFGRQMSNHIEKQQILL